MKKSSVYSCLIVSILLCLSEALHADGHAPFRGIMIDAPRTVESIDYYFKLIDFCQQQKWNVIIFRLTDDEGSAYHFKSHPELNTREGAFNSEELTRIIQYAAKCGVEMIPEIESFGHARYILDSKRYKSLGDGKEGKEFHSISPVNETSLSLMKDLYKEIASIFPSAYFHIGCDEVTWGSNPMSAKALKTKSRAQIWGEYVNALHASVKALGKKTIIWGDVPIYKEKEVLDFLDRDMVIMDWNYSEDNVATVDSIAQKLLSSGFQIIGCPAVSWCEWGPRVGAGQYDNIRAYTNVYARPENPNNLGLIISNWVPQKYLASSMWDSYLNAAALVNDPDGYAYEKVLPAFVGEHYGTSWNAKWKTIYETVYPLAPQSHCSRNDQLKLVPWADEGDILDLVNNQTTIQDPFQQTARLLEELRPEVKKNLADYDDLLLTVRFLSYNYNRNNALRVFFNSGHPDLAQTKAFFVKAATADSEMLQAINKAWDRNRRTTSNSLQNDRNYMLQFPKAAAFSKQLSVDPQKITDLIKNH